MGRPSSGKEIPPLSKAEPDIRRLAPCPKYRDELTDTFRSENEEVSKATLRRPESTGDRVTTLILASMPLDPYRAEVGPRIISMRSTRSISSPKSSPKKLLEL